MNCVVPMQLLLLTGGLTASPIHQSELVFPLHDQHNHAPGIVELANGELLVSWYRGSGERSADDVAVYGARLPKGATDWSEPFLMHDTPGFPDCNTCMMVDANGRLWLFFPTILANTWESCLTNVMMSQSPTGEGSPKWNRHSMILLKPDDFQTKAMELLDSELASRGKELSERAKDYRDELQERLGDKLYQRLGWQPRCKPTVLPSGRILLPLYSDTYSFSIMAISDDGGESWIAGQPMMGFGNIQPSVLRRNDGTLVAYMRENGPRDRIRVAESSDDGQSWGRVGVSELPNPGSGLDGVRLQNGNWILVYNDTIEGRQSLAVSLSDDEGHNWKWTRHLEKHEDGAYHYPSVIQSQDGLIHVAYSYFTSEGKSMKHAVVNEDWIREGPTP